MQIFPLQKKKNCDLYMEQNTSPSVSLLSKHHAIFPLCNTIMELINSTMPQRHTSLFENWISNKCDPVTMQKFYINMRLTRRTKKYITINFIKHKIEHTNYYIQSFTNIHISNAFSLHNIVSLFSHPSY